MKWWKIKNVKPICKWRFYESRRTFYFGGFMTNWDYLASASSALLAFFAIILFTNKNKL